jgi:hypothetical protein
MEEKYNIGPLFTVVYVNLLPYSVVFARRSLPPG